MSGGVTVKIEVNGTKRGLIGEPEVRTLCEAAREEFQMAVKCRTVSFSQLFGGKVSAALKSEFPDGQIFEDFYKRYLEFGWVDLYKRRK